MLPNSGKQFCVEVDLFRNVVVDHSVESPEEKERRHLSDVRRTEGEGNKEGGRVTK